MATSKDRCYVQHCNGYHFNAGRNSLASDQNTLLIFHDFPAMHRIHFRTTNPFESICITVHLRSEKSLGGGSLSSMLSVVFKLAQSEDAASP